MESFSCRPEYEPPKKPETPCDPVKVETKNREEKRRQLDLLIRWAIIMEALKNRIRESEIRKFFLGFLKHG
jgi:hypothetical protein